MTDNIKSFGRAKRDKDTVGIIVSDARRDEIVRKIEALGYKVTDQLDDISPIVAMVIEHAADPEFVRTSDFASELPVIVLAENDAFDFRLRLARLSVEAVLNFPLDTVELAAWLKRYDPVIDDPHHVLIVDDDELSAFAYAHALHAKGMQTSVVTDPNLAVQQVIQQSPDLVLMDLHMPGVSGIEIAKVIRQSRQFVSMPIVFLSAEKNLEMQHNARQVGGDDFVAKPVNLGELSRIVELRVTRARELAAIMDRDSLTGLLNHARFKERLLLEFERSRRTGSPISVALVDLDRFKSINDTYGHQAGDRVIQTLAHTVSGALRKTDVVSRYGGEEFAVILMDTETKGGVMVMDKAREAFKSIEFDSEQGPYTVTLSAGIGCSADFETADDLLNAADQALYRAKANGRDRVEIAVEQPAEKVTRSA